MGKIDVEKIYIDSMLSIKAEEKEKTEKKFIDVVNQVNPLLEIDTEGVDLFEITTKNTSQLRDDEIGESLDREKVLANTKHREYGYFKIGKVVE